MGIDSSIAMGVRPVQIESPMNALAQMMQIKQAQQANDLNTMKMDEYQRGVGETNRLNSLYSGAIGPDGKVDRSKLILGAASQNLGSKIPGLQKGFLETDESQGKVDKQKSELIDASLKRSRGFLDTVKTPEDYLAWHEANHLDPVLGPVLGARGITAASARASITAALQQPGGFAELLNKSAMGIEKFAEMNKPSVHVQNLGGSSQMVSTPGMGGAPTVLSNTPITQSADSVASNATSRANNASSNATTQRGQNLTDSRARAGQEQSATQHAATLAQGGKAPAGYRFTADGNMEAIPGGPSDLKNSAPAVQKTSDAKDVLSLLDEVDALLPKATGSYLGAGADSLAGMVGYGTQGAQSGAQLKALEGALVAKMPKMSGPQSDKDVLLYKQMAGQVGDSTLPVSTRQAASKIIRKLNEKHAGVSGIDSLLDKYK